MPGQLQNFNTEKGFKDLDKTAALKQVDTVSKFGVLSINMQQCCLPCKRVHHEYPYNACRNHNKMKDFVLLQAGQRIWLNILSGAAEEHPSCLCLFVLLSYADLKKFVYWSWYVCSKMHNKCLSHVLLPAGRLFNIAYRIRWVKVMARHRCLLQYACTDQPASCKVILRGQ